jgi:metallo-beta-lactamase family protein
MGIRMKITFLGAAQTVTGSRHLVETSGSKILLDCGMFQGFKPLRERNWKPLAIAPKEIDAVVLSHAHLDHSGWLPVLVRDGFKGPIYASKATRDLTELLLLDSAHLQEEDARRANRGGWSRHSPAKPLYNVADAKRALSRMIAISPGKSAWMNEVSIGLAPSGHLLGANMVILKAAGEKLVFSGDLGRHDDLLMPAPSLMDEADILLIESTYGNRLHASENDQARFAHIIRETLKRKGTVLLPSFAVGRAQALMLVLQRLKASGDIPLDLPIFLDSPMAASATALYQQHGKLLRISAGEAKGLTKGVTIVASPKESQALIASNHTKVVISASGMATGGRVLNHLVRLAPNPRHTIVLPGYQVPGTRGATLVSGAREVKIHGQYIAVKAEVVQLAGLSGHADANGLMGWMKAFKSPPKHTFVIHGEPDASDALRKRIKDELGWTVSCPEHGASEVAPQATRVKLEVRQVNTLCLAFDLDQVLQMPWAYPKDTKESTYDQRPDTESGTVPRFEEYS